MTERQILEQLVAACNYPLKEYVGKMDPIILLRNAHPTFRQESAKRLVEECLITKEQSKEFTDGMPWNIRTYQYTHKK